MSVPHFQNAIFALASEAAVQDALFPDFTAKGDELVIEYGDWYESVKSEPFSETQLFAIAQLDNFILSHSGPKFAELYTDNQQLYSNDYWAQVRVLAHQVIHKMGWVYQQPSPPNAIYVGKST